MKKVNVDNYREDKLYSRVVRAVGTILARSDIVPPCEVFIEMSLLTKKEYEDWRLGRVPCLERVIHTNISKVSRILRLISLHVHDLNMLPSFTAYHKWGKGKSYPLRFSKSGIKDVEDAYSRHFLWNQSTAKKLAVLKGLQGSVKASFLDGSPSNLGKCVEAIIKLLRTRIPKARDSWHHLVSTCDGVAADGRAVTRVEELIKTYVSYLTEAARLRLWKETEVGLASGEKVDIISITMDLEVELLQKTMHEVFEEAKKKGALADPRPSNDDTPSAPKL